MDKVFLYEFDAIVKAKFSPKDCVGFVQIYSQQNRRSILTL